MTGSVQYHEDEWRRFANERRLQLRRREDGCYESRDAKAAHDAWIRRSQIEAGSKGPAAYYNAALCHASTAVYEALLAEEGPDRATQIAKLIQGMRV